MIKYKKGFTLIEILVVATIIAMLAGIAATSYITLTRNSRDARRRADLEQIRSALEMYRSNNNTYPVGDVSLLVSTYIQSIPTDPKAPTYTYHTSTITANDYTIGAYLENTSSTCSVTVSCTIASCNYCLGPYGQK